LGVVTALGSGVVVMIKLRYDGFKYGRRSFLVASFLLNVDAEC